MRSLMFAIAIGIGLLESASAVFTPVGTREFVKIRRFALPTGGMVTPAYQLRFRLDCTPLQIERSESGEVRARVGQSDALVFGIQFAPFIPHGFDYGAQVFRVRERIALNAPAICGAVHRLFNAAPQGANRLGEQLIVREPIGQARLNSFFQDGQFPAMRVVGLVPAPRQLRDLAIRAVGAWRVFSEVLGPPPARVPGFEIRHPRGSQSAVGQIIDLRSRDGELGPLFDRCELQPLAFLGASAFPEALATTAHSQSDSAPWVESPDTICQDVLDQFPIR